MKVSVSKQKNPVQMGKFVVQMGKKNSMLWWNVETGKSGVNVRQTVAKRRRTQGIRLEGSRIFWKFEKLGIIFKLFDIKN